MTTTTPAVENRPLARPFASFQLPADVRIFQTCDDLPCNEDPDLFFDPRRRNRAIARCAGCPFRGRCAYNAVATRATHGIWGGVMLPGHYPNLLKPIYARLAEQFQQRRRIELGDAPVAPLPDYEPDNRVADNSHTIRAGAA
jgi:WhiB family transcriptional regulator, redox-sensing transcriptional regulator